MHVSEVQGFIGNKRFRAWIPTIFADLSFWGQWPEVQNKMSNAKYCRLWSIRGRYHMHWSQCINILSMTLNMVEFCRNYLLVDEYVSQWDNNAHMSMTMDSCFYWITCTATQRIQCLSCSKLSLFLIDWFIDFVLESREKDTQAPKCAYTCPKPIVSSINT